jgi:hypothetical protein
MNIFTQLVDWLFDHHSIYAHWILKDEGSLRVGNIIERNFPQAFPLCYSLWSHLVMLPKSPHIIEWLFIMLDVGD